MLAASLIGALPLSLARQCLAVLIAAAVALAPVGAAMAAHGPAHGMHHAGHHSHGAMQAMASQQKAAEPCAHKMGRTCCCHDKGTCTQTCVQKCFGQMAVMPPERTARHALTLRFATNFAERPPGWSSAPQLPPPRA